MVRIVLTARGAEQAIDGDGYIYYFNRKTESVKYWLCSQAGCNVRIITTISTSQLVGNTLPMHEHGTNLNKRKAKEAVASTIKKFATLPSTTAKQALCEITNTLLASENPDSLYAMTSAGSIKSALWREKKISDRPKLPKSLPGADEHGATLKIYPNCRWWRIPGAQLLGHQCREGLHHAVSLRHGCRHSATGQDLVDERYLQKTAPVPFYQV